MILQVSAVRPSVWTGTEPIEESVYAVMFVHARVPVADDDWRGQHALVTEMLEKPNVFCRFSLRSLKWL